MKPKIVLPALCIALLMGSFIARSQPVQLQAEDNKEYNAKQNKLSSLFPDAVNAKKNLSMISALATRYRALKNGRWPETINHIQWVLMKESGATSHEKFNEAGRKLFNPDVSFSKNTTYLKYGISPYAILSRRPDGSSYDSPRVSGTRDALAFTELYYTSNYRANGRLHFNPQGGYLVLWHDGEIDAVPYDQALYTPSLIIKGLNIIFPTQAGVDGGESISYEELQSTLQLSKSNVGKPILEDHEEPVMDNGGPEALVTLSRLLSYPNRYGIEREKIWQTFSLVQEEFTLSEVQTGAQKLGLPLQLRKLSLEELEQLGAPALFLTTDDKRIVTLANLDDKEAIVIDRGMTRVVSREILNQKYNGEALVPQAAENPSAVVVQDPVRVLTLQNKDEEVKQQVTITNRGKEPLTLQIERPIPGVTSAELSSDTVAPGESATLSLTIKWRDILKGDSQNVFVFLKTNDAVRPRLQLGFKLQLRGTITP